MPRARENGTKTRHSIASTLADCWNSNTLHSTFPRNEMTFHFVIVKLCWIMFCCTSARSVYFSSWMRNLRIITLKDILLSDEAFALTMIALHRPHSSNMHHLYFSISTTYRISHPTAEPKILCLWVYASMRVRWETRLH